MSCLRPSNKSSRLTLPLGPSNSYSFSTATHGIRRRSAASASRAWVNFFSFTSSCWCAASHSPDETILGEFISSLSFLTSLIFILAVLCLYLFVAPVKLAEYERGHSSAGRHASGDECKVRETNWAHRAPRFVDLATDDLTLRSDGGELCFPL